MRMVAVAQSAERRIYDRKVAESRFDSRTDNESLCLRERMKCKIHISHRAKQSTLFGGQSNERLANRTQKVL